MTLQDIEMLQPDPAGIITLFSDGVQRRFIKTKLLSFLQRSEGSTGVAVEKPANKKSSIKPKKGKPGRPRTKKRGLKKFAVGEHRRRPVIALLPDGTEQQFISCKAAAASLKIDGSNINKVLSGRYGHVYGIKFKNV